MSGSPAAIDDFGVLANAADSPVQVHGLDPLTTPVPGGPAASLGLDPAEAHTSPMNASGGGVYVPAAHLPETPARQQDLLIYDGNGQFNGAAVLPPLAARQPRGQSMGSAPGDWVASGGAQVGAAATMSSSEGPPSLPVHNVPSRYVAEAEYGMLDVGGLQRLTNMYSDDGAQVRARQTAPRATGQAGQPSIVYVSGAVSRYEPGPSPEQDLQVRIAEAEEVVRRLHAQAGVVNGSAGSPSQRLGEQVVYYREPEPPHIFDVQPARSGSPPRAPTSAAHVNATRQRRSQSSALGELGLDSAPLKDSAVQRVTRDIQELMQGFKPSTIDSLNTVDAKLHAATLRMATQTKGELYVGLLIVAAGIPVDTAAHDPTAQADMRRMVLDALAELTLTDAQRTVLQQLPDSDVNTRMTLFLATNLLQCDSLLQTIDAAARQLFMKNANDDTIRTVGTHQTFLAMVAFLRKHAGDSCSQRNQAAIQNLIVERPIPTAPGPATAGSRRVGKMSLSRLVVAIKAEMGARLVEETAKVTPLNLALQAIIKGLPVAAQSTGAAPHIVHNVFVTLTRLSIDSSATVDKVTQSLNAIMLANAGMQDVPMLLKEADIQPKYAPAVSAYVAETVPAPATERSARARPPKPFQSEQRRLETLRKVGDTVLAEQQRSRSPVRPDDSRQARQHSQGAAPGRHSQGRGRPVQPAPQMQQRDAIPSPRRQEQRQQQQQYQQQPYQQPQEQRPPPICFKFNSPGGCTFPNCRFQHVAEAHAPAAPAPPRRGGDRGQRAEDRSRPIGRDQVSFIGSFHAADAHAAHNRIAPLETAETVQAMHDALLCTVLDKEANRQRISLLRGEEAPYAHEVEALAVLETRRLQEQADFDLAVTESLRPRTDLLVIVDTAAANTVTGDTVASELNAPTRASEATFRGIAPNVVKATHEVTLSIVTEQMDDGRLIRLPPLRTQGIDGMAGRIIVAVYQLSEAGCTLTVGERGAPSFILLPADANGHRASILCAFRNGILVIAEAVRVVAAGDVTDDQPRLSSVPVTSIAPQASYVPRARHGRNIKMAENIYMVLEEKQTRPSKTAKRRRSRAMAQAAAAEAAPGGVAPAPVAPSSQPSLEVGLQTRGQSKRQRQAAAAALLRLAMPAPTPASVGGNTVLGPEYTFRCPPRDELVVPQLAAQGLALEGAPDSAAAAPTMPAPRPAAAAGLTAAPAGRVTLPAQCVGCDDHRVYRAPEMRRCRMQLRTGQCENRIHATCFQYGMRLFDGDFVCSTCVSQCVLHVLAAQCGPAAAAAPDAVPQSAADAIRESVSTANDEVVVVEVYCVEQAPASAVSADSMAICPPQARQIGSNGEELLLRVIDGAPVLELRSIAHLARVCRSVFVKLCRDQASIYGYTKRTCWSRTPLYNPALSQMHGYIGRGLRGLPPRPAAEFDLPLTHRRVVIKEHHDARFGWSATGQFRIPPPGYYDPPSSYRDATVGSASADRLFIEATYSQHAAKDSDAEYAGLPELCEPAECRPGRSSMGEVTGFVKHKSSPLYIEVKCEPALITAFDHTPTGEQDGQPASAFGTFVRTLADVCAVRSEDGALVGFSDHLVPSRFVLDTDSCDHVLIPGAGAFSNGSGSESDPASLPDLVSSSDDEDEPARVTVRVYMPITHPTATVVKTASLPAEPGAMMHAATPLIPGPSATAPTGTSTVAMQAPGSVPTVIVDTCTVHLDESALVGALGCPWPSRTSVCDNTAAISGRIQPRDLGHLAEACGQSACVQRASFGAQLGHGGACQEVYVIRTADASPDRERAHGRFAAPLPQAPRRMYSAVTYRTYDKGILDPDLWGVVSSIVHQLHCLVDSSYGGLAQAVRDQLPYSRSLRVHSTTSAGVRIARPGTIEVCYPGSGDHSRNDLPFPVVINLRTQVYPGVHSGKVLQDFGDTERDRLAYFQQALERISDERPRIESVAIPDNIGSGLAGGSKDKYLSLINRWAAANPTIRVYVIAFGQESRAASPRRTPERDRDHHDRTRRSPQRSPSPNRRTGPDRAYPAANQQTSRRTYVPVPASGSSYTQQSSPARNAPTASTLSRASHPTESLAPRPLPVCRYAQQRQQCPFERRPGGCKFAHPAAETQPSIAARASRASTSASRSPFRHPFDVPLLKAAITRITELPFALGTSTGPGVDPRQAGIEFSREYERWQNRTPGWEPVDDPFVVFDWGAKSFSAGEAVRCTRHGLYLACDLFEPGDARVRAMLHRHNQRGVRAAYMRGHPGRAPTEQELEAELWSAFGVRLESVRVLLASPNCQTVSSARGPVYADRDPTLLATSRRAKEDDAARGSLMSLGERLQKICPLFTAVVEQPRTGIALEVHDVKQRLLFKHWYVNTVDHCQFATMLWPMKPTLLLTLGDFSPMNVTCRDGTSCEWKLPSGQHQLSIVDYNSALQQRLDDDDIRRDAIPVHETAAIIANALRTQDSQQQHACRDQQFPCQPSQPQPFEVYTARLAGRVPSLDKVALDAKQLHQACLHVAPQRILDSIPGWADFRLTAANGRILSGSEIQLSDLQITGTCHECIRGRSDAPPSRHTAQQLEAKRAALRRQEARPNTAHSSSPPPSRSSSPARRSARVQTRQIA